MKIQCLTASEIARSLGVSVNSVTRAARQQGVGVYAGSGRLLGVSQSDVAGLRPIMHATPGNPGWIAARKK